MNRSLIIGVGGLLARGVLLCAVGAFVGCDVGSESTVDTFPDLDTLLTQSQQADIVVTGEHLDSLLYFRPDIGYVWFRQLAPGWSTVWLPKGKHTGAIYVFSAQDNTCLKAIPVDAQASVYFPAVRPLGRDSLMILSYIFGPDGERTERSITPYVLQVHKMTPETCELVFAKPFRPLEYGDDQDLPTQVFFQLLSDILERMLLLEIEGGARLPSNFDLVWRATYVWSEDQNTFVQDDQ